ncbi:glycosyltransferase [Salinimicrobium sediminilitoris]|uniref:glycosyltransferase n=1 Tax=Salinimicrobium sediminilitoris TaxID=2876715 RepID=UPI001E5F4E36|nr:glycosyltransferase [Salinimicrobium sediminilitoris]MCC8358452.1 glycosyltransferase [Salinimicrobium sediminilitoris]
MNLVIYNPNSFGGNYDYAHKLLKEYGSQGISSEIILPRNSGGIESPSRKRFLIPDVLNSKYVFLKKVYFLIRSFFNPIILWFYLLFKKRSIVYFNDFDQVTSIFWAPFFHILRVRHRFAVMLHDPDRDAYFPFKKLSEVSMKAITSFMDWGLYHEKLPDKTYYKNRTSYFSVPHGIFSKNIGEDVALTNKLAPLQKKFITCTILGNIRREKNYEAAIQSLKNNPQLHLIIAGKEANSSFTIDALKTLAGKVNVENQITWINKYLSDSEINSVIAKSDLILMNYASSFTSQSGILNLIAPFSPHIIVSKTSSALFEICERFNLGTHIEADKPQALKMTLENFDKARLKKESVKNWEAYRKYASWKNNITISLNKFQIR